MGVIVLQDSCPWGICSQRSCPRGSVLKLIDLIVCGYWGSICAFTVAKTTPVWPIGGSISNKSQG